MTGPDQPEPLRPRDLSLIVAAAAAMRAVYFALVRATPLFDYLHLDPLYYVEWGRRIAAGDWIGHGVFEQSPLYPYLLGAFFAVLGERLLLLRVLQLGLGVAACTGIGLVGSLTLGRRVGLAAGLLAAVYGPFLFYEGQVMKSFLNYVLATAALLAVLRWRRGGTAWALGAGAALGLLALVRANSLLLVPVLAAWAVIEAGLRSRRGWAAAAGIGLGAALVVAPVTLRNLAVSGEPVLVTSGGGEVFYIGNYEAANGAYLPPPFVRPAPAWEHQDFRDEAARRAGRPLTRGESSRYWFREGLAAIAADPVRWLRLEFRKLALFWNARELPDNYSYDVFREFVPLLRVLPAFGIVAPLALVGIGLEARRWRVLLPLYLLAGAYLAGVLLFFNFSRFRLPALPVLLVLAGATLVGVLDRLRAGALGRAALLVLAAAVLALPMHLDLTRADDAPGQDRLLVGYSWLDADRPAEALEAFHEARRRIEGFRRTHPGAAALELGSACYGEGSSLLSLGRDAEALEPLHCAVRLSPRDPAPLADLAALLTDMGQLAEAEAALERLVVLRPRRFAGWFDLASLAFRRGDAALA
ncbi:MAG: glycosyltransferase family 39 protein, partial [Acidobacteriota bacterium]